VTFKVKSDASPEKIKEMAEFSPVLDVVSHGTPVLLQIKKALIGERRRSSLQRQDRLLEVTR